MDEDNKWDGKLQKIGTTEKRGEELLLLLYCTVLYLRDLDGLIIGQRLGTGVLGAMQYSGVLLIVPIPV